MINRGEITAFLSMIILLILAVVGTILESARVNVAKTYIDRALTMSMDNILSEYYYPLYESYHLFLLDGGYGTGTIEEETITRKMKDNMFVTFSPEAEFNLLGETVSVPNTNLLDISIQDIQLDNVTCVTDYNGKPFFHEATAYMKYQMPAELIENAGKGLSFLKDAGQAAEVIEKKLKLESSLSVLGEGMLDLIHQVEGIKVGRKGITYNKNGLIAIENNFVKKISIDEVSQENVNISKDIIWNSLKGTYINPNSLMDNFLEQMEVLEEYYGQIKELRKELDSLREENPEDTREMRANIYKEMDKIDKKQQDAQQCAKNLKIQLKSLILGTKEKIEEALHTIELIEEKRVSLEKETKEYEKILKENGEDIPKEIFKSLEEDFVSQKKYLDSQQEKKKYNLSSNKLKIMKDVLISNRDCLELATEVTEGSISGEKENVNRIRNGILTSKAALSHYNIRDLNFDYSSFTYDSNVNNPVENCSKLINKGILDLVVDDINSISKKEITSKDLPSIKLSEPEQNIDKSKELAEDIKNCKEGYQEELSHSFGNFGESEKMERKNTLDEIIEKVLYEEYLLNHFKNQENSKSKKIERETVLEYEQEYLIEGKLCDYDNFSGVVCKLIFTRTILNYLYLITDKPKSDLAYATAAGIVGFTCIEPLISLTKTVILLVWAYEEALVDVRALLEQKAVPFFKTKDSFCIKFEELFLISKTLIKKKADELSGNKIYSGDMNYEEYMRILLFITNRQKKSLRALDLIQENMNCFYKGELKIENCIFGYKVKADFNIGAKFIRLPFIQNMIGDNNLQNYSYGKVKENSY